MKRLAIAFLTVASVAACSGKSKNGTTTAGEGSGSGSAAIYGKKYVVTFGITQNASSADVYLQTTDETGHQVSYPLGTFDGQCQLIKPAADMKAVSGVNCAATGSEKGVELDAVISGSEIVVLKLDVQAGVTPDPMARTELTRVKAPAGSAPSPEP